jgi:hypothetical protein
VKGLDAWITQRGWEAPPEFVARQDGPAPTAQKAAASQAKLLKEIEHMENVIAERGPTERLVSRLNVLRSQAGLPAKMENVTAPQQARGVGVVGDLVRALKDGARG